MTGNVNGLGDFKSRMIAFVSQKTGISAEELKKMSVEELQQLAKAKEAVNAELANSISSTKNLEEVDSSQFSLKEPKVAEEKDGWLKRQWKKLPKGAKIAIEVVGGMAAAGALVAGAPALIETARGLSGLVNGTALAVGATAVGIGGLAMLSGCIKQETHEAVQNVIVNLDSLSAAIALLTEQNAQQNETLNKILDMLNKINFNVTELNQNVSSSAGAIINAITSLINTNNLNNDALMSLIRQVLEKMDDMSVQNQQNTATIINAINEAINHLNSSLADQLTAMLQEIINLGQNQQDIKDLLLALLAEVSQMHDDQQQNAADMLQQLMQHNELLNDILAMLEHMNATNQAEFQQLLAQLMSMQGDIQALLNAMNTNNNYLNHLLAAFNNLSQQVQDGIVLILAKIDQYGEQNAALLLQILDAINQIPAELQPYFISLLNSMDNLEELLNNINATIQNWSQQQQTQFAQIMARLMAIIGNQNNANDTLNAILNAIQEGNMSVDQVLALLNNISGSMGDIMTQLELMDAHHSQHYQNIMGKMNQILNAIMTLDANTQNSIAAILAKLDTMDEHQMEAFLDIIQRMIDMQNSGDANAQAIITAIQNLDVSGGGLTQAQLDTIISTINSLSANLTTQATGLAALLAQILAKVTSIDDKVNAIQTIAGYAQNILTQMQQSNQLSQQILNKLDTIQTALNNIHNWLINNCPDNECCDNILAILQEILDALVNGDWNHEGIEDDWGDILG